MRPEFATEMHDSAIGFDSMLSLSHTMGDGITEEASVNGDTQTTTHPRASELDSRPNAQGNCALGKGYWRN